jgi:hypothetical protein
MCLGDVCGVWLFVCVFVAAGSDRGRTVRLRLSGMSTILADFTGLTDEKRISHGISHVSCGIKNSSRIK